jgi:hypothetical protein
MVPGINVICVDFLQLFYSILFFYSILEYMLTKVNGKVP